MVKPITNTLVVEGSPAKFVAEYSGEPQPQVSWLRNALQTLQETRNIKVRRLFGFEELCDLLSYVTCRVT